MDPYIVQHLFTARHDDLVRQAEDSRIARESRDSHDESRPAPKPASRDSRSRRFRLA
ncbi:hypothetical protein [Actinophytocola sp.]|jgi:hypothetical protein|uniref:hypothetical protein n=1 Tax=Actinophytocola sp. TaxID=1872138 RepID=UPI002D41BAAE|nr:hypothetical protein [Actinophytocola sp.]HYQ66707.1 hypothetical protein [Actinophytocola sp.]